MASLNRVYLVGNLTRDPEVKYLPDGTPVADLRLAVSETYRSRASGEQVETTCYVDVVVWRKQAEACGQYLSKGSPVLVEGKLHLDEWEAQDGGKRSKLRVRAQRVQFLSRPPKNAEVADGSAPGNSSQGQPMSEPAVDNAGAQDSAGTVSPAGGENLGDDDNLPF